MTSPKKVGIKVCEGYVRPEWIDCNQHMNVAYYVLAFDQAVDALWSRFGITDDYIESMRGSTFAVECHLTYQNELHEGDRYIVTSQILAYDEKRIHQFQRIYQAENGLIAATAEWMNLHVDLTSRRVSAWPEDILKRIGELAKSQSDQTRPAEAGKQMSITNPLYTL